MTETHVVIGGSGSVASGSVVVRLPAERGAQVRAISRGGAFSVPPGVETVGADATNADRVREVCDGADVVYHCAMPPFAHWRALFPPMTDAILAGAEAAGARLVFADDFRRGRHHTARCPRQLADRPRARPGITAGQGRGGDPVPVRAAIHRRQQRLHPVLQRQPRPRTRTASAPPWTGIAPATPADRGSGGPAARPGQATTSANRGAQSSASTPAALAA